MIMLTTLNTSTIVLMILILAVVCFFLIQWIAHPNTSIKDEYEILRDYVLNEEATNPSDGARRRPKLWIHTTYEKNSRQWKTFYSRDTANLNEPYIHLTVRSILNQCGNDFQVCLIDDTTFSRLLPSWDYGDLSDLADPIKSRVRRYGLALLVYTWGGMTIPNSFLCQRNLVGLWTRVEKGAVLIGESRRKTMESGSIFVWDSTILAASKHNSIVQEYVEYLKPLCSLTDQTSLEPEITGQEHEWWNKKIQQGEVEFVPGTLLGIRSPTGKPIGIEEMLEEYALDLSPDFYGIWIPHDEILKRPKYQWFAVLPMDDVLESNSIIVKYLQESLRSSSQVE